MAGTAYPKRAIKQNRRTTRAKIGKPVKLARMGEIDYTFLFIVILLLSFGLVMQLSASAPAGNTLHNNSYYFFNKQFLCAILGLIGMWVISRIDYNKYKNTVPKFMIVCTILLVCVLIPGLGVKLNGSRRWLNTPFLQLQPSEFMKPIIAMYFARLVDSGKYNLKHLKGNLPYIGVMLIVVGLMLMETHLSGAIVIAGIGVSVMIAGGTPFADIRDESYQVVQGLYAIGSGGIFGLGLGQSVQKYSYLPEPYNDFIFAIVCEELGLIGAAVVILLFAALIIRAIRIAMNAPDTYGSLVAVGIAAQLAIQTILNIAVATSSVPNTGVALPFFSYGGTAIITLLCEMGVLLNISRHSVKD